MLSISILWENEKKLPLKATVEACYPDNGFLVVELASDQLTKDQHSKMLLFPASAVLSVEIVDQKVSGDDD